MFLSLRRHFPITIFSIFVTLLLSLGVGSITSARAAVSTVDDSNYKTEVEDSTSPVFIDFYATWCGPCKKVSPIVDELSEEYKGQIKFVRVDVEKAPKTAERFKADQLPTLVLRGKNLTKGVSIVGYQSKERLKAFIEGSLPKVQ